MNFDQHPETNPYSNRNLEQLLPLLAEPENMTSVAWKQLLTRVMWLLDKSSEKDRNKAIELILAPAYEKFAILEQIEDFLDEVARRHSSGTRKASGAFLTSHKEFKEKIEILRNSLKQKPSSYHKLTGYAVDLLEKIKFLHEICKRPEIENASLD